MSYYFTNYPKVEYDVNGTPFRITNLTVGFQIVELLQNSYTIYYDYEIQDGETPESIAETFYNDGRLDWIIFITNSYLNPSWEWPLSTNRFNEYIRRKYESISYAHQTIHHYEQILSPSQQRLVDGIRTELIPERTLIIDEETYDGLANENRRSVSIYEHESRLNDEKRRIQLLNEEQAIDLVRQINTIFR